MKRSVAGLLLIAALSGCGQASDARPSVSAEDREQAESLYRANCIACHGAELQGIVGPDLRRAGSELSAAQIVGRIEKGGGGMPAFRTRLTEDEIQVLADWLAGHK
ncbi:c-type cytochrome [Cohnella terricola]|uniref:c-type cytochrome n=1 Tax=Cohnella terricola TaxID=1289167 RepID=UPI001FE8ACC2|nr:cytochrome c [Cohnella terricola]